MKVANYMHSARGSNCFMKWCIAKCCPQDDRLFKGPAFIAREDTSVCVSATIVGCGGVSGWQQPYRASRVNFSRGTAKKFQPKRQILRHPDLTHEAASNCAHCRPLFVGDAASPRWFVTFDNNTNSENLPDRKDNKRHAE